MGRPAVLKVDIVADAKGVGPGVAEADRKFGKLGSTAGRVGKAVAGGLVVAAGAAVAFGVKAVSAASEVEQSYGAVDAVFGKNAATVKKWAASAATDVGLAKSEYANLSALVGAQLTNMGRSTRQAAVESRDLVKTGADLAATFGGSTKEAVEALSSALKGETDPIERYGVSIKQSDVSARLAAEGLDGLTGKAAKQAQASAVLGLITEQTAKAHGQFARESDSLAGQQQVLAARFENAKATLGQKLLPAAVAVTAWFSDKFLPAAMRLGGWMRDNLGPIISQVGGFITGTLVPATQRIYGWFVDKMVPAITGTVMPVLRSIRGSFQQVAGTIDDNSGNLNKLAHFLGDVVPPVAKVLGKVLGGTLAANFRVIGGVISGVISTVSTLVGWVDTLISRLRSVGGAVSGGLGKVAGIFSSNPNVVGMTPGGMAYGQPGLATPAGTMATASAGTPALTFASNAQAAGGAGVYVDRRTYTFRIDGALDEVAVAAKIDGLLKRHAIRSGRAVTYGGGG